MIGIFIIYFMLIW